MNNIDIIRAGYGDFLTGNIEGVVERFADEIEVSIAGAPEVPYAGTYRNRAELAGFFQKLNDAMQINVFEPREYFADGDRVIALGHYAGEVRKNGHTFAADWCMAWTVRDGRIVAMKELTDPSELKKGFA
ncbi:MAG TPA: nuclear transport factor 2 family protein [Thermoanaerobaculia bacterium]|nr:nuclear transport factor 2 family protein [Thermoanaerobaculia bacterium]